MGWFQVFAIVHRAASGNHHSQQTVTRTESQTSHVLTHRWVSNNENTWTQGEEHHTLGAVVGDRGETAVGGGARGGITLGKIPNVDDGGMDAANHHGMCITM